MPNQIPYSNFHELNLDWILDKLKELEKKVDDFTGSADPSDDTPVMDGTASAGVSDNYARGDHVHPTDTSRASQADFDVLSGDVNDLDTNLTNAINTVDAKIDFSTASPAMDGVPNPGSSAKLARADHVHPTDTTRAAKDEFDTLKARVDAFSGSANPSDATPLMDGVGAAGTGGNYSRGDHVHPSDTSKLDIAGGHITGDLLVDGNLESAKTLQYTTISAIGWFRIAQIPRTSYGLYRFTIVRLAPSAPSEIHTVEFYVNRSNIYFRNEFSEGDGLYITKIRFTSAGAVDIYSDRTTLSNVGIRLDRLSGSDADTTAAYLQTPTPVADSPDGETISRSMDFVEDSRRDATLTFYGHTWTARKNGKAVLLTAVQTLLVEDNIPVANNLVGQLPAGFNPPGQVEFLAVDGKSIITVAVNGNVYFNLLAAVTAPINASFSGTWITY